MYAVCPGGFEQLIDGTVNCANDIVIVASQSSFVELIDPIIAGKYITAGAAVYISLYLIGSPVKAIIGIFKHSMK